DGIRDPLVTGVQTCALPILRSETRINENPLLRFRVIHRYPTGVLDEVGGVRRRTRSSFPREGLRRGVIRSLLAELRLFPLRPAEIGRASCRERDERGVG